jgi:hypothetical protein
MGNEAENKTHFSEEMGSKKDDVGILREGESSSEVANPLMSEPRSRHDFYDAEAGPRDVVTEHL